MHFLGGNFIKIVLPPSKKVHPYQKEIPVQENKQEVPKNIFLVQNDGNSIKFEQLAIDVAQNC